MVEVAGRDIEQITGAQRGEDGKVIDTVKRGIEHGGNGFTDLPDGNGGVGRYGEKIIAGNRLQVFQPRQILFRQRLPDGLGVHLLEVLESDELGRVALLAAGPGQLIAAWH